MVGNMPDVFSRSVMKNRGGYVLGVLILLSGLLGLFGSILIAYLDSVGYWGYPTDFFSAFFADRGSEQIGFGFQGLQLFHYFVGGVTFSVFGGILVAANRGVIRLVEEATVILKCKKCKSQWHESMSKKSLQSMNYPQVKSIARRKCPNCAKFVRPRIVQVVS